MKKHSFMTIVSALAVMLMFSSVSHAKVYLTITGETFKKITIGVPYFKGEKTAGSSLGMSDLLNKDLDFSGFFIKLPSLIDRSFSTGCGKRGGQIRLWRSIGIDIVLQGRLSVVNGGSIWGALFTTPSTGRWCWEALKPKQNEWRRVTHRLADDIIFAVTGEKGIKVPACSLRRAAEPEEIYLSDFDGQNVARLPTTGASRFRRPCPRTKPRPSYREGRPNLYVTDFDKKNEIFVDRSEGMKIGTSWLGNSTLVYSHTSGKTSTIYAFDVGSRSKKVLVRRDGILTSPTVSPDGSRLVFVSDMFGSPQIFSKALPSGEPRRLTYHGKYNSAPAFSPKGDLIAFVANLSGGFEICTMNADGSNQRLLTNDGTVNDSPQFSPRPPHLYILEGGVNRLNVISSNAKQRTLILPRSGQVCTIGGKGDNRGR